MTRRGRERSAALRRALRTLTPYGYLALGGFAAATWWLLLVSL